METLLFAGMAILMFLFGFITHWILSGDDRRLLKQYRQHARELNRVEARRQALEAQRRQWGG